MVNEETILVRIKNKIEGEEQLKKEGFILAEVRKQGNALTKTWEKQTATNRERVVVTQKSTRANAKQIVGNREILTQGPKFQAHFLGLMFGGMALNRAMSNLTATSMEWVGIGELMSTTMGVVMLPATLELLDLAVLPLMDALLSMPESVQTVIGVTVIGLGGLGKVLEIAGQISLGAIAFPGAKAAIIKAFKGKFAKGAGVALGITAGLTIAWVSIQSQLDAIKDGDLQKEILSVLGIALGLGIAGLSIGAVVGGAVAGGLLGFTIGVAIGLIIHWFIKENKKQDVVDGIADFTKNFQGEFFEENLIGQGITGVAAGIGTLSGLFAPKGGGTILDFLQNPFAKREFAVGGNVTNSGLHFLHEGETVLRKDQASNQNGNISVTYNVNVSDKREFEQMLRVNNQQLVRDVRRKSIV